MLCPYESHCSRQCPLAFLGSAHPHRADNKHPKDYRQPSLPSISCCRPSRFSLSPLSTFSPAPPSSPLGCLSPSGAQTFLFQAHHHHCPAISFSTAMWHLLAHMPFKPLLQARADTQGHLGSPVLSSCARTPGTFPYCSSQLTGWYFWEESELHDTPRQEGASYCKSNKWIWEPCRPGTTMPCFNGRSIVNSSVTP